MVAWISLLSASSRGARSSSALQPMTVTSPASHQVFELLQLHVDVPLFECGFSNCGEVLVLLDVFLKS